MLVVDSARLIIDEVPKIGKYGSRTNKEQGNAYRLFVQQLIINH